MPAPEPISVKSPLDIPAAPVPPTVPKSCVTQNAGSACAVEAGEAANLPPAILLQGTGDDNVTPDMADRFTAAWQAKGGSIELHKFNGQPHTFVVRDPTSDASRRACELARDFVKAQARV